MLLKVASLRGMAGLVYMHVAMGLAHPFWLAMNLLAGLLAIAVAIWLSRRLGSRAKAWRRGLAAAAAPALLMLASMWAFLGAAPGSGLRLVSLPGTYFGTAFFFVPFVFVLAYALAGFRRRPDASAVGVARRHDAAASRPAAGSPVVVAIDGPAASGKGTLAKRLADHLGFHCLDTGLLYRAVARDVARGGFRLDDTWASVAAARRLDPRELEDAELRGTAAGDAASIVARIPEVRAALLAYQREFARRPPGAVLDGRDIGTAVCPDADVKIFVTASPEVRARRRFAEFEARGMGVAYETVLSDILARDARDTGRANAPMAVAADAMLLDTSNLSIEAAFDAAVGLIKRKISH